MKNKIAVIIPARYGSTRLEGKALLDICGKPMIQHVYEQAKKARNIDVVIVATDDKRIKDAVENFGGVALMTSSKHKTGSDRIAEVARNIDVNIIVNLQGDEPLIDPKIIEKVIEPLIDNENINIASAMKKTDNESEFENRDNAKVVVDENNNAIYFSRSLIPYPKKEKSVVFKHIGIYAYRKPFLLKFIKMERLPLERAESLEQLRVLEHGYKIKMVETEYDSHGVDTQDDLEKIREILILI